MAASVVLGVLVSLAVGDQAQELDPGSRNPEYIIGLHCYLAQDGNDLRDDPEAVIESLGEPGRKVLLAMAASADRHRLCAWSLLAQIGDQRVLPSLRGALLNASEQWLVRQAAGAHLMRFQDAESIPHLMAMAGGDDPEVRRGPSWPSETAVMVTCARTCGRHSRMPPSAATSSTRCWTLCVVSRSLRRFLSLRGS